MNKLFKSEDLIFVKIKRQLSLTNSFVNIPTPLFYGLNAGVTHFKTISLVWLSLNPAQFWRVALG